MNLTLDLQNNTQASIPDFEEFHKWIEVALESPLVAQTVSICIVDPEQIQQLNLQFREKNKPTNVLSFPSPAPVEMSDGLLGDIVLCAQVIEDEANAQNKPVKAHWAHMVIHSTLHLQGYDHQTEADAFVMESKEIKLMKELGFGNPYQEVEHV